MFVETWDSRARPGFEVGMCAILGVFSQMTCQNSLSSLLRYADRNAMAFSIEARAPFLDHRLVEFVLSGGYTKWVLRRAVSAIIPDRMGFATPERGWQQTSLRPLIAEALESNRLQGEGI